MISFTILVQALGVAYAAGLDLYATVAIIGLMSVLGWAPTMPGTLGSFGHAWVIAAAIALYIVGFVASLIPGIGSAWETVHSLIRPPAAAALAAAATWNGDPGFVLLAALLGGAIAVVTHTTKLGLCYVMDCAPAPGRSVLSNVAQLVLVGGLLLVLWRRPYVALAAALAILVAIVMSVPLIWRVLRQVFSGRWMPGHGLLQQPRSSSHAPPPHEEP